MEPASVPTVRLSTRGAVSDAERREAEEALRAVAAGAPRPVLSVHGALVHEPDPARERPAIAKATLELDGHLVRAHVATSEMRASVDLLAERLRRAVVRLGDRARSARHETGVSPPGEWRHGDLPAHRPEYYPRPREERKLVRRKTYALRVLSPEEAAWEMELLDLGFYLFREAVSGQDMVVYRRNEGPPGLRVLEPPPDEVPGLGGLLVDPAPAATLALPAALEVLDVSKEPFVFFRDEGSRRGAVAYRRYDGHYGVVTPAG